MREWLLDGFRYDRWANRQWVSLAMGSLEEVGWADSVGDVPLEPKARAAEVFAHVLWAQRIWLARIDVSVVAEGEGWIDALYEAWVAVLIARDPAEIVRFDHPKRGPQERSIGDMAWHVVNHGTYHRGQLREIAELAGWSWPETDVSRWRAAGSPR